jgi:hypothetical protein
MLRRATLVVALTLAGCQGVPVGHYRYRVAQEPGELVVGALLLPLAFAGDALINYLFLSDPSWTERCLSLISPFHNAWDAGVGPTECPELVEGVAVTRATRQDAFAGEPAAILAAARAHLERAGWTVVPVEDAPWKLRTAWRAEDAKAPVLRRLHVTVTPPAKAGEPVDVRARLLLAATAGALVAPERFAELVERLQVLEREKDEAEDAAEDVEADLITYHSLGDRGEAAYADRVDAERRPHEVRAESAADDILDVEDQLFRQKAAATREALLSRSDEPLRALWRELERGFPAR